jgi:MinD-like ATPase involved in chromosome partitioning or flagellar assembly
MLVLVDYQNYYFFCVNLAYWKPVDLVVVDAHAGVSFEVSEALQGLQL